MSELAEVIVRNYSHNENRCAVFFPGLEGLKDYQDLCLDPRRTIPDNIEKFATDLNCLGNPLILLIMEKNAAKQPSA